jgi:hypothetical protein
VNFNLKVTANVPGCMSGFFKKIFGGRPAQRRLVGF